MLATNQFAPNRLSHPSARQHRASGPHTFTHPPAARPLSCSLACKFTARSPRNSINQLDIAVLFFALVRCFSRFPPTHFSFHHHFRKSLHFQLVNSSIQWTSPFYFLAFFGLAGPKPRCAAWREAAARTSGSRFWRYANEPSSWRQTLPAASAPSTPPGKT